MPRILAAEDVVRRIAGECAFVDERGGGIRLEPGGPQPSFIALLVSRQSPDTRAMFRRRRCGSARSAPGRSSSSSSSPTNQLSVPAVRVVVWIQWHASAAYLKPSGFVRAKSQCLRDSTSLEFMDGH